MSFAFHCPQGHLLQAEPAHAGMQSQCPFCGAMFLIPAPGGSEPTQPAEPTSPPSPSAAAPQPGADFGPPVTQAPTPYLGKPAAPASAHYDDPIAAMAAASGRTASSSAPHAPVEAPREQRILHIPCPNGHELETPDDMLNEDVVCPHCHVQFQAREKDSIEYKKKREREREIREMKTAKMWIWIAAIIGVGALVLIIALIAMQSMTS